MIDKKSKTKQIIAKNGNIEISIYGKNFQVWFDICNLSLEALIKLVSAEKFFNIQNWLEDRCFWKHKENNNICIKIGYSFIYNNKTMPHSFYSDGLQLEGEGMIQGGTLNCLKSLRGVSDIQYGFGINNIIKRKSIQNNIQFTLEEILKILKNDYNAILDI